MPNWCYNQSVITGIKEEMARFTGYNPFYPAHESEFNNTSWLFDPLPNPDECAEYNKRAKVEHFAAP